MKNWCCIVLWFSMTSWAVAVADAADAAAAEHRASSGQFWSIFVSSYASPNMALVKIWSWSQEAGCRVTLDDQRWIQANFHPNCHLVQDWNWMQKPYAMKQIWCSCSFAAQQGAAWVYAPTPLMLMAHACNTWELAYAPTSWGSLDLFINLFCARTDYCTEPVLCKKLAFRNLEIGGLIGSNKAPIKYIFTSTYCHFQLSLFAACIRS